MRHLGVLTGLADAEIEPSADTIPVFPALLFEGPASNREGDLQVKIAVEHARSAKMRAEAEHRSLWPTIEFVGEYTLLPSFNNYSRFYPQFEGHNSMAGISLRLKVLDFAQSARAHQADIDVAKAEHEVDAVESQSSDVRQTLEDTLKEMQFARDAAQLDYMLARIEVAKAKIGRECEMFLGKRRDSLSILRD